jgi:ABC-type transport system involved in multi-copper enzyme maturation permease subunit
MSTAIATALPAASPATRTARPSFPGILQGELFKITRQRTTWIVTALLACFIAGPNLLYLAGRGIKEGVQTDPLSALYLVSQRDLQVLRVFGGFFLLLITALVIGQEYQLGTIRILLGRGVGRLQLLGAKTLALAIVALVVVVGALLIDVAGATIDLLILTGNLNAFSAATAQFWADTWMYVVSVLVSMGATLLLGVAANVVGRSLAFGLGVGLSWFPADNIGSVVLALIAAFTNNTFWSNLNGYFLGPVLNIFPSLIVAPRVATIIGEKGPQTGLKPASALGITPLSTIDATHAWLVIGGYCLVFAIVAIVLTWRRDVLE